VFYLRDEIIDRAIADYFRSGGTDEPARPSDVIEHHGRVYVRLVNDGGILAVYRLCRNGTLMRLSDWPPRLNPNWL
jgi:hypothetical protein